MNEKSNKFSLTVILLAKHYREEIKMRRCGNCQRVLSPAAVVCRDCERDSKRMSKNLQEAKSGSGVLFFIVIFLVIAWFMGNS